MHAGEVFAWDPEPVVALAADGPDHRVVVAFELFDREVAADTHVAEEPEARVLRDLVVDLADRLDLLVVWRDAAAHEAERRGQSLEHVDAHFEPRRLQQALDGVERRGA